MYLTAARIFEFNNKPIKNGKIIYLCEREVRAKDNFALQFALQKSKELNLPLKIIHPKINYEYNPKQKFIDSQIAQAERQFKQIGLDFEGVENLDNKISKTEILKEYFKKKEGSIAYAIEKLKFISGRKKAALDVHLKDLKLQITEIKKQLETKSMTNIQEIELTKQLRILENDLRK